MRFLAALLLLHIIIPNACAQVAESTRAEEGAKLTKEFAKAITIETPESPQLAIELEEQSLLKWSNPVTGSLHGSVYLWVSNVGHPIAIASVIKWYSPRDRLEAEFHSMIDAPIVGILDGEQVWNSKSAGVEFRTIPDASVSTGSENLRLRQMRRIARGFDATRTDANGEVRNLRRMPQPIYRYPEATREKLDGGIFVFAQGTNPEVVLVVEARTAKTGAEWVYALARMNSVDLRVRRQNEVVWEAPMLGWRTIIDRNQPYLIVRPR